MIFRYLTPVEVGAQAGENADKNLGPFPESAGGDR